MNYETTMNYSGPADPEAGETVETEAAAASTRRRRIIVAALIAAVLIAIAAALLLSGGEEADLSADAETVPSVTVLAPGQGTIAGVINATGTIAARREMPVGVVGEGGRVVSVPVDQGEWVRQGQVLAVIDRAVQSQQAASAAATVSVNKADAELAQANLDRALKLVDRGFISKADVDRLTATRDAAVARVKVAEAQYRELLARNDRLNIVAPAAGLLLTRSVEPGQVVGAGSTALFSIAKGGEMEVQARLSETDLARVSVGTSATVTPVGTGKQFTGQVWQVAPTIDEQSRQGIARVALAYAPELRPGGFAEVRINSGTVVAPQLPESAILSDEDGSFVYVVDKDNKVRRRKVTTGLVAASGIAVTSGLEGNEKVVLRAGGFLNEGDTVRPVAERAEPAGSAR
ncbi:secretion protein HylD [Altererythrobacter sp. B11]|uniref:efflux RND transporter periplasmic adaptor subunit n=1 Tax=Altererythrobacter sp. B11 TaxID=2060312 RepID=UPI000DC6F4AF|nr:efflux RND transporter periplasmic adaptor subunit [Altererythrobacter sp. B11]BBC71390.1 secretion protein HylD [Altererythrobacter sp. B11]